MEEKEVEKLNEEEKVDTTSFDGETLPAVPDAVMTKINEIETTEDLKNSVDLFNLSITKKEMARALKQNELLDIILKQAGDRLTKRPDELSTKDLLDYMNAFQANIERTQSAVTKVESTPTIQINNNHQDVVVNIHDLSRSSSETVVDAIKEAIGSLEDGQSIEDLIKSMETIDLTESSDEGDNND